MKIQKVDYVDEKHVLEATIAYNDEMAGKRPVVLIFHAWRGKDEFVEQKAIEMAKLGYVGCALDLYGKGILGNSKEENAALMAPLKQDRVFLKRRMLAYESLIPKIPQMDPSKIGAMGFCFGGLCALDLARSGADLKGVVSLHGLLSAPEHMKSGNIKAKVLALHGYDDPMVPLDQVVAFQKEMTDKKVDWQFHVFGGAMHAFTNPEANDPSFGTVYNANADKRSSVLVKNFFREVFS